MIERKEQNGIVTLRLAHGKVNALDIELCDAITASLAEAAQSARAVILTGTGSVFSAGVDLIRLTNEGAPYVARFFPALVTFLEEMFRFPRPLVAAVNGHAIAGGCLMAAAADYRLMSGGTIGVPELAVGVPFPTIAIDVLRFATGTDAQRLATLGEVVPAVEAKMIDEIVDPGRLLQRATEVAERLASIPADAFRLTKLKLRAPFLREADDREALAVWSRKETHEHIRRYMAKLKSR